MILKMLVLFFVHSAKISRRDTTNICEVEPSHHYCTDASTYNDSSDYDDSYDDLDYEDDDETAEVTDEVVDEVTDEDTDEVTDEVVDEVTDEDDEISEETIHNFEKDGDSGEDSDDFSKAILIEFKKLLLTRDQAESLIEFLRSFIPLATPALLKKGRKTGKKNKRIDEPEIELHSEK